MKTASLALPPFSELPTTYAGLCGLLMPRIIHDDIEHDAVTEIIDRLAPHPLNADQADYLETLAELSEAYETQNLPQLPKLAPHEFLAAHLDNIGMSASAWGELIGIDRSTASRLIRGERSLNTTHIRNTASALSIAPELML